MTTRQKKGLIGSAMRHVALMVIALFQLSPLLIMFFNSFRTDKAIKKMPIALPESFHFENYVTTWNSGEYGQAFKSSFLIAFFVVIIVLACGGLAAYALAKLPIKGRSFFLGYFTLGMSIPGFLFIVPNYYVHSMLGIINTHISMIVIYSALFMSFNLLLLRSYLIGVPKELEEAGKIDGCNEINVLIHITMPIAAPIFLTVVLLVFVQCWNEFFWANVFLQGANRTVSTKFYDFVGKFSSDLAKVYTAGSISMAPIVILYAFLQKNFIEGLTSGAVKG